MTNKFRSIVVFAAVVVALANEIVLPAQTVTPSGQHIPAAQWRKSLLASQSPLGVVAGQTATIVPTVIVRRRQAGPNNASIHTAAGDGQDVTEIYEVMEGGGTLVTGGAMRDPANRTAGLVGGESYDVKPGDFIVIPPGTAHWFSKIDGHITYLEIRVPGNVLQQRTP